MRQRGPQSGAARAVRYSIGCPAPPSRRLEVVAFFDCEGEPGLELFLPAWTPGSYRIRDHAARLQGLRAWGAGGEELAVCKTAGNRWRIATNRSHVVRVGYRAHATDIDAAGNIVGPEYALITGAATFLGVVGGTARPHLLDVRPHESWGTLATSLRRRAGGEEQETLIAADYDELIDSLLFIGNATVSSFRTGGVELQLVSQGHDTKWDLDRRLAGLEVLCATVLRFWGRAPFDRYTFLSLSGDRIGGLEHSSSSVIMTRRSAASRKDEMLDWIAMACHELFHAWNGRHLWKERWWDAEDSTAPRRRDLWVVEGIASYYDHLLVHRAGLSTREELFEHLASLIRYLRQSPGRFLRTLEEASCDVWDEMGPDERSARTVSVYVKGALLAWSIDIALRRESDGRVSLDDVMREALHSFGGRLESAGHELEELIVTQGGASLRRLLECGLRTTEELDLLVALGWLGLELRSMPGDRLRLTISEQASDEQRRHLEQWLKPEPLRASTTSAAGWRDTA